MAMAATTSPQTSKGAAGDRTHPPTQTIATPPSQHPKYLFDDKTSRIERAPSSPALSVLSRGKAESRIESRSGKIERESNNKKNSIKRERKKSVYSST